ncbi:MAG: cysteine hydrolase [Hyphomicrobiales bacterium]|nr:MAG: cysteine hydrolase [Hyphomicrobiales bacterium]
MSGPMTLFQLAGADQTPPALADAQLVLIDMQNEYLEGPLAVSGVGDAVAHTADLLAAARQVGAGIIHVVHKGYPGSLFDREAPRGQIIDALAPLAGEEVIEKALPNAFAGTGLGDLLRARGAKELIVVGFMSHMCVSSTVRAALDEGFRVTVDADGCGSRDLPDGRGGVVVADVVSDVALVELSDRFAVVVRDHAWR